MTLVFFCVPTKKLTLWRWVAVVRQSSRCRYNLCLQSRKPQLLQAPVGLRYKSCKDLGRLVLKKFSSSLLPLPNRTIILAKRCQIQCNISKHLWESLLWKTSGKSYQVSWGRCLCDFYGCGTDLLFVGNQRHPAVANFVCSCIAHHFENNTTLLSPDSFAKANTFWSQCHPSLTIVD